MFPNSNPLGKSQVLPILKFIPRNCIDRYTVATISNRVGSDYNKIL